MQRPLLASFLLAFSGAALGCSSTTTVVQEAPATDGGTTGEEDAGGEPVPFALTSTAFAEGDSLPAAHTCNGANTSPPLAWTAGPAETKSYALVFTDKTNGLVHSVIYDIPVDATGLPAKMQNEYQPAKPAGTKQTTGYDNATYGYLGPCPPSGEHTYEFALYALNVDALADTSDKTTRDEAVTAIKAAKVATTKLTVKYQQP